MVVNTAFLYLLEIFVAFLSTRANVHLMPKITTTKRKEKKALAEGSNFVIPVGLRELHLGKKVWSKWALNFLTRVFEGKTPPSIRGRIASLLVELHKLFPTENEQRHNMTLNKGGDGLNINLIHKELWFTVALDPFDLEKTPSRLVKEIQGVLYQSIEKNQKIDADSLSDKLEEKPTRSNAATTAKRKPRSRKQTKPEKDNVEEDENNYSYLVAKPGGMGRWLSKSAPNKSLEPVMQYKGVGGDFIIRITLRREAIVERKALFVWSADGNWTEVDNRDTTKA